LISAQGTQTEWVSVQQLSLPHASQQALLSASVIEWNTSALNQAIDNHCFDPACATSADLQPQTSLTGLGVYQPAGDDAELFIPYQLLQHVVE
jgi:hypothetical protein